MNNKTLIVVIDAQGGGLGKALVEKLKSRVSNAIILALGTNAVATGAMKKAGADQCATGENAIIFNAKRADIIVGGIGIISANGMMGEISPKIAETVSSSSAVKVLVPVGKCNICIPGTEKFTIQELIDIAIKNIIDILYKPEGCDLL
jgi:hypothetical protein